jgi:HAD superfamily hydrolase (TIGR01459 family)
VTAIIDGLGAIAHRYDVLLCDVWGVIHDGARAFEIPCAALARWRDERGQVILISNSPRPAAGVEAQLAALGVPRAAWTSLATSGDVTRTLLAARAPGPAWRIGPDRDDPLYEGLGLAFSGPEEAAFIACTGPNDDETETPEDYRSVLATAAARGLTMICANPDIVVQRGPRLIYCGGALAALYETLGGQAIMAGKPFGPIYDLALDLAARASGAAADRARVLAVGDGVSTDLAGAAAQGLDALFIADGIHADEVIGPDGGLSADALAQRLAGVPAAFALRRLVW